MPRLWAIALAWIVMCLGMAPSSFARPVGAVGAAAAVSVSAAPAPGCACVGMGLPYNACGRCDQVPPASITNAPLKQAWLVRTVELPRALPLALEARAIAGRVVCYDALVLPPPEKPPQRA